MPETPEEPRRWFAETPDPDAPPSAEIVVYPRLRCPFCRQAETKVTSTQKPIRYHLCQICGKRFKSVEA